MTALRTCAYGMTDEVSCSLPLHDTTFDDLILTTHSRGECNSVRLASTCSDSAHSSQLVPSTINSLSNSAWRSIRYLGHCCFGPSRTFLVTSVVVACIVFPRSRFVYRAVPIEFFYYSSTRARSLEGQLPSCPQTNLFDNFLTSFVTPRIHIVLYPILDQNGGTAVIATVSWVHLQFYTIAEK